MITSAGILKYIMLTKGAGIVILEPNLNAVTMVNVENVAFKASHLLIALKITAANGANIFVLCRLLCIFFVMKL